ncbi:MAG TPA: long-chain fatty acid--CoA ligase [Ktedonobacterales bacterium]
MCAEISPRQLMGITAPAQRRPLIQSERVATPALDLEAFAHRRIPTLPPAPEENVVVMFRNRCAQFGPAPRWRAKRNGVWSRMTWSGAQAIVNELIAGMYALGVRPGARVGILSETRWEWLAADWAVLGLGAVTVPIYASLTSNVIEYMLNNASVEYVFVENAAQYEKLTQASAPGLKAIILMEPLAEGEHEREGEDTTHPTVISFDALRSLSGNTPAQAEELAQTLAAQIRRDDIASIIYTSGTTARPKGVIHTHATLMAQVRSTCAALTTFCPGTTHLLWLPLAHVLGREEHLLSVDRGGTTLIAESTSTLPQDIREGKPNIIIGVPRIYEKAYAAIEAQAIHGGFVQRRVFAWARRVGIAVVDAREAGKHAPRYLRLQYQLADRLVFRKVRAGFGGELEFSVTGSAPIARDLLRFFHAAGILLLEGWGLTETMGAITVNRVDKYRLGSVGLPVEGHKVRIGPDGEVLVHGPCVFTGYLNNPAENAAAFDSAGWLRTGDLGAVDSDGFVYITGRKKELIVLANGKKVGPDPIEALLKSIDGISQAFVYGDRKPYLIALLTLDQESVTAWARRQGIASANASEIAASPAFARYLDQEVARVNTQLARYETIKRFAIAPEDFTIENGMLTPTLKLRRGPLYQRYAEVIERLYAEAHTPAPDAQK